MTSISTQEIPFDELGHDALIDLLRELENGAVRKLDHFR